jgi:hypothetical protein
MQQTRAAPLATLDAVLERITYAGDDSGDPPLSRFGIDQLVV